MWSCFKPQNKKNTKEFKGRYSPSSEVSEQRTPSPVTQKVELTSVFLQSNPLYKHLMLEYTTHMEHASNTALRKAFDLRNTNLETQTAERGVVHFERRSRDIPPIQRTSSTSSVNVNLERKFRRLDPNFV